MINPDNADAEPFLEVLNFSIPKRMDGDCVSRNKATPPSMTSQVTGEMYPPGPSM